MDRNNEELTAKVYDFIKSNIVNFIVAIISIAYILWGQIKLDATGYSPIESLAKAGLSIVIGIMIKQGMGENGFNKAYNSQIWRDNLESYSRTCNIANEHIELVDNFYACEEIENKKKYRTINMNAYQMKYSWFFDEKGDFVENPERYNKLDKKQRKILKKCIKVKIYGLNLFSEYGAGIENLTKKEATDKTQRQKAYTNDGIMQIITAVAGAYFIPVLNGWDWGAVLMSTIQVAIWLGCGAMQLFKNYNFVIIDKIDKLKRKKELLIKFAKGCDNGLYNSNPYEVYNNE